MLNLFSYEFDKEISEVSLFFSVDAVLQTVSVWMSQCRNFTTHNLNFKNLFHIGWELQFNIL